MEFVGAGGQSARRRKSRTGNFPGRKRLTLWRPRVAAATDRLLGGYGGSGRPLPNAIVTTPIATASEQNITQSLP